MIIPRYKPLGASIRLTCATIIALLASSVQAGDYYKWVDAKGVTHFSEKPAPGSDAKKIGTATKYSEAQAAADAAAQEAAASEAAAQAAKPADNPQNAENCKLAQDRLKSLRSGQRIRLVGADGKFSYLDENQVKEEMEKTQAVITGSCR